ncbi:MAG TPA: SRPBCC domain-containing protein [Pyrinomonadaceae bacterium]|jgi:uncharacterized protein YndB with AHSA1/START domain|nr:SRPBCC domain-containing protein [Pyrinomonadaceae bacterium]
MEIKFQVQTKIQKPIEEVFEAVQNPDKLSGYFTNGGASAPLVEGTTVEWAFEDTPGEKMGPFPVKVKKVVPNELIVFEWEGAPGRDTRVEMNFEKTGPSETLVRISESGWKENQEELNRSYSNCMGWSQMVSALKAYVEYGINLRKGAYEGLYKQPDHQKSAEAK